MDYKCLILTILLVAAIGKSAAGPVWTLIHDVVQNNVAGAPVIHQHTEWDFNPDQGKERRVQYERLNGHLGEELIARLGMGMSFDGPWGTKVSNQPKPDLRYNP